MKVKEWMKLSGKLSFRNAESGITLSHSEEWYWFDVCRAVHCNTFL